MTYISSARQPEPEPRPTWTRGAERLPGGPESSAVNSAANDSNVVPITAAHMPSVSVHSTSAGSDLAGTVPAR
ncbi:hypothetical protein ABTX62_22960 [Streptomyces sp. NPDC096046]|uniref:hypothetical protein n=1 Tax=Streptomyces sp. NPDC096046 TaxID=3155542 RepID=UPI00331C0D9C